MATIHNYFQRANNGNSPFPNPTGPLSKKMPSSLIEAANCCVSSSSSLTSTAFDEKRKRGPYKRYSPKEKAEVANYATHHGTSAAIRHFKYRGFADLKWTTVNDWKQAMTKMKKKSVSEDGQCVKIVALEEKKRGRPSVVPESLTQHIRHYLIALRDAGGVVNTSIVLAAAQGILQRKDPASLLRNGGYIDLQKSWGKYLLKKMNFVKRKATTKCKVNCANFELVKTQYLLDIKVVVEMEEIPDALIINWDQTGINYVPVSEWTMSEKGSKRVEVFGLNDKRQITVVFGGTMSGDFLPVQLVYQGKTKRCLPTVDFPKQWHVTCTPNHWCNENTMLEYLDKLFLPYVKNTREDLHLDPSFPALAIFDEFNGQVTDAVLRTLEKNHVHYVIVPPNTTDKLQPLDVSVNKPAKEFLRNSFQTWYADQIAQQVDGLRCDPVELKLSVVKPLGAKWMIQLSDYLKSKPDLIINGFKASGIYDSIKC